MKIRAIIIDDEYLARERISNLLKVIDDIEVIKECSTGKEAIMEINRLRPSMLFLDIKLTDMTGFNVLECIDKTVRPVVIFVTAYDEFALNAFEYFALDYLQKPFKDDRFYKSINKSIEIVKNNQLINFEKNISHLLDYFNNQKVDGNIKTKFPVKINNKIIFIKSHKIMYINAFGNYVEIYINNKKYVLRNSLNSLISQLNSNNFLRIHRSTIINLNFIQELIYSNYGEVDVKMVDNKLFRISKSYKKEALKILEV
jgi:two-component system, LytTR family, response regulator